VQTAAAWSRFRGRDSSAHESVFRKTVLAAHIEYRKGIVLQGRQILLVPIISEIISEKWLLRNTFG
jgi:hypothetical protein